MSSPLSRLPGAWALSFLLAEEAEVVRLIAYVDGFNLYFGMREANWRRTYWLDVDLLVRNLLRPDQALARVNYFTARVSGTLSDPDKPRRQNAYLEALHASENLVLNNLTRLSV